MQHQLQHLTRLLEMTAQELLVTQQQHANLAEEHQQYVAHTSTIVTRLQAQMQQLLLSGATNAASALRQDAPTTAAAAAAGDIASSQQGVGAAAAEEGRLPGVTAWRAATATSSRNAAGADWVGILDDNGRRGSPNSSREKIWQLLEPLQPQALGGRSAAGTYSSRDEYMRRGDEMFTGPGPNHQQQQQGVAAAGPMPEAAVLPSYAQMRRQLGRASVQAAEPATGNPAAATRTSWLDAKDLRHTADFEVLRKGPLAKAAAESLQECAGPQGQIQQLPGRAGRGSPKRWKNADAVPAVIGVADVQLGGSWAHLEGLLPRPGDLECRAASLGVARVGEVYVAAGMHGAGQEGSVSDGTSVSRAAGEVKNSISFNRHLHYGEQLQQPAGVGARLR